MHTGPIVPPGEQLLWRGQPDPSRVRRRVIRDTLGSLFNTLLSVALFLGAVAVIGPGSAMLWFIPVVLGFLAVFWLVPTAWQAWRMYRRTIAYRYVLTEQRLLIGDGGKPIDLRLANLSGLALDSEGEGYGSLLFAPPLGGGPERLVRWAGRFLPQLNERTRLMVSIPDASRVLQLIQRAQAENAPASAATANVSAMPAGLLPLADADLPTASPVAPQPILTAMADMPLWFGGAFLAMGLSFVIVMFAAMGLSAAGWPILLPVGFAVIGAVFVFARLRLLRVRSRLQSHGVTTTGRVVDVASTGVRENHVEQWVVRYEFSVMGRGHRGQSRLLSWADAARYVPGDTLELIYDPADPAQSMPIDHGKV